MKKSVRVIIEKEYIVDIPDILLTEEHIKSFEEHMFPLEGDKVEGLFKHAARCAAYDWGDAEGLGEVGECYKKQWAKQPEYFIGANEQYNESEEEII